MMSSFHHHHLVDQYENHDIGENNQNIFDEIGWIDSEIHDEVDGI